MRRLLAVLVLSSAAAAGCAGAAVEPPKVVDSQGRPVEVKFVKKWKDEIEEFKILSRQGRVVKEIPAYHAREADLWFLVPMKLKDGRFYPAAPLEEKIVPLSKEELQRLKEGIENLKKNGVKVGAENAEIAVFIDPLCPFCKMAAERGELDGLKDRAVFIPVSVHGQAGEVLAAYLLKKARTKPMAEVLKEWFSKEFDRCGKDVDACVKELGAKITKQDLFLEETAMRLFTKLQIPAVPAFVNLKNGQIQVGRLR
jgi:hypothetical protein